MYLAHTPSATHPGSLEVYSRLIRGLSNRAKQGRLSWLTLLFCAEWVDEQHVVDTIGGTSHPVVLIDFNETSVSSFTTRTRMLLKSETWRSLPPRTVEFPVESTILFAFRKYGKMMESFTVPWMKFFARMFMRKDYWWCSLAFRRRSSRLHLCHHQLFH